MIGDPCIGPATGTLQVTHEKQMLHMSRMLALPTAADASDLPCPCRTPAGTAASWPDLLGAGLQAGTVLTSAPALARGGVSSHLR